MVYAFLFSPTEQFQTEITVGGDATYDNVIRDLIMCDEKMAWVGVFDLTDETFLGISHDATEARELAQARALHRFLPTLVKLADACDFVRLRSLLRSFVIDQNSYSQIQVQNGVELIHQIIDL